MTVARASSAEEIRTGTTDPHTFVFTPAGTPKGIVIAVMHGIGATALVTTITYGGVSMFRVDSASDALTEPGNCQMWFLGSGIPTGAQTVSADLTSASTTDIHFVVWEISAAGDTTVIDWGHVSEDLANPTIALRSMNCNKLSLCAMYTGTDAPGGTLATGNTLDHTHDHGNFSSQTCYETTVDDQNHTIGWSTLASDDTAMVALAVTEVTTAPGYLWRPTSVDMYVRTPDHASLDILGDLDLRLLVDPLDSWNFNTTRGLIAKRDSASISDLSFEFLLFRSGGQNFFQLNWKEAAGTQRTAQTVTQLDALGGMRWVRATLDVDNGASQYEVKFYTSTESVWLNPATVTWTQWGATITGTTGVTNIFNSPSPVELGSIDTGTTWDYHGKIFYAEVRNGIGGTVVANPDFRYDCQKNTTTQLTDNYGRVWTIGSPAEWIDPNICMPPHLSRVVKQRRFATHMAM